MSGDKMKFPIIKAVIIDWARTLYDNDQGRLFPDSLQVVQSLSKHYALAIVSLVVTGTVEQRWRVIDANNLRPYFRSILFVKENKDEAYQRVLRELNVPIEQVAIIDDRVIRGITWGNRHRAVTIWVQRGKFSNELPTVETGQPTHTVTTLQSVLPILLPKTLVD